VNMTCTFSQIWKTRRLVLDIATGFSREVLASTSIRWSTHSFVILV
jgi:hypothetical protein